jgi:hypothetical protein
MVLMPHYMYCENKQYFYVWMFINIYIYLPLNNLRLTREISGYHGGEYEDDRFLGYSAV